MVDETTVGAIGKAALGVISSTIYTNTLDTPENQRFVAEYRAKSKEYPNLFSDYGVVVTECHRSSLAGNRRRHLEQGQARRGDGEGRIQGAARAVPLRP